MGYAYYTDGRCEPITPKNRKDFSLAELQSIVGGYIETLRIPYRDKNGSTAQGWLVCNEEGKLLGMQPNMMATAIILKAGYQDTIVGNAVFCLQHELK